MPADDGDRVVPAAALDLFVGRETELATLRMAWRAASTGRGNVIFVAGEAGIGKTRLVREMAAEVAAGGGCVLRGACHEDEWAPPYGPIAEAVTAHVRAVTNVELMRDLGSVGAALATMVPELAVRLPDLPKMHELQPDEERFRLFDAASHFLATLSTRQPVLLVLDDVHWADRAAIALLRHVARSASRHALCIVATFRDTELATSAPLAGALGTLQRESQLEILRLRGLGHEAIGRMAGAIVGAGISAPALRSIRVETQGNPFFVRELLRHLATTDPPPRGGWPAALSVATLGVPTSIRQLVRTRCARLAPDTQRLLTIAACCNAPFDLEVVASIVPLAESDALAAIEQALREQVLRAADSPDRYDFTHALFRHALHEEISPSRRVRLHRQLAETIERRYRDELAEHAAEIAHHYHRSVTLGDAERGLGHALTAAATAEARAAHDAAARMLQLALEFLPSADTRRPRLVAHIATALTWALSFAEAEEVAREASRMIASQDGAAAAADFLATISDAMDSAGGVESAWIMAREGLRYVGARRDHVWVTLKRLDIQRIEAEDPSNPGIGVDSADRRELLAVGERLPTHTAGPSSPLWIRSSRDRLLAHEDALAGIMGAETLTCWLGEYRRAEPIWRHEAEEAEARGRLRDVVRCWAGIARCRNALGDFTEAARAYARGVEWAKRFTGRGAHTMALIATRTEMCLALDDGWEALRTDPEAQSNDSPERATHWSAVSVRAGTSLTAARRGKSERARSMLDSVIEALDRAPGWVESYTFAACTASESAWLLTATEHAPILERNVRAKVVEPDFRWPMMDGRLALARLCALQGRVDEACEWFARSRRVLDEQGALPLRAIVDFDEGSVRRRTGDEGAAAELLDAARERFRGLGMVGWIRRLDAFENEHGQRRPPPETVQPTPAAVGHREAATFRSVGDLWRIAFEGQVVHLRAARGFEYIAQLLRDPERELHATELIELARPRAVEAPVRDPIRVGRGDAGALLDDRARREYQRRLADLRSELDESEQMNDIGRAARLREEIDALTEQLVTAARGRRTASHSDRARVAVTKAIGVALDRIATAHPALGRHLTATIRRGYFCVYRPDPRHPIAWGV